MHKNNTWFISNTLRLNSAFHILHNIKRLSRSSAELHCTIEYDEKNRGVMNAKLALIPNWLLQLGSAKRVKYDAYDWAIAIVHLAGIHTVQFTPYDRVLLFVF